eukprot:TRINITY_DN35891_c0_g1_i1.p1 TRINITY_DN35891_c0_g1~~TRINITY_DN35891_c0_g1_i1.p1  ORF type:complete len:265 (-),score=53.33 TRINITY_DN35891_c0_g1_i1:469-1263(-)
MDFLAEQADEIEALEAILEDDLREYDGNTPAGWEHAGKVYIVPIIPEVKNGAEISLKMELIFAHTGEYPDEAPLIRLRSEQGLSDADIAEATQCIEQEIEDNIGTPMIFTLVSVAQEWLTERMDRIAQGKNQEVEDKLRREREEEERLQARRIGTQVTVERFNQWLATFQAEIALKRNQLGQESDDSKQQRLTGKQWFLQREAEMRKGQDEEGIAIGQEINEEEIYDNDEGEIDYDDIDDDDDFDEDDMIEDFMASQSNIDVKI